MSGRPKPVVERRLRGRLDDLDAVHEAISEFSRLAELPDAVTAALRLALDELITNVVEHGFRGRAERFLALRLEADERAACAVVEDDGPAFDPTAAPTADTNDTAENRPVGGLGLYLIRRSVDAVEYSRRDGRNCVVIRKRR